MSPLPDEHIPAGGPRQQNLSKPQLPRQGVDALSYAARLRSSARDGGARSVGSACLLRAGVPRPRCAQHRRLRPAAGGLAGRRHRPVLRDRARGRRRPHRRHAAEGARASSRLGAHRGQPGGVGVRRPRLGCARHDRAGSTDPSVADVRLRGRLHAARGRARADAALGHSATATGATSSTWRSSPSPRRSCSGRSSSSPRSSSAGALSNFAALAYSAGDVVLLALLAALFFEGGRRTISVSLMVVAVALVFAADLVYYIPALAEGADVDRLTNAVWLGDTSCSAPRACTARRGQGSSRPDDDDRLTAAAVALHRRGALRAPLSAVSSTRSSATVSRPTTPPPSWSPTQPIAVLVVLRTGLLLHAVERARRVGSSAQSRFESVFQVGGPRNRDRDAAVGWCRRTAPSRSWSATPARSSPAWARRASSTRRTASDVVGGRGDRPLRPRDVPPPLRPPQRVDRADADHAHRRARGGLRGRGDRGHHAAQRSSRSSCAMRRS